MLRLDVLKKVLEEKQELARLTGKDARLDARWTRC